MSGKTLAPINQGIPMPDDTPDAASVSASSRLVSEYANDPDMIDLVEMFIDEMPDRISAIEQAVHQADIAMLSSLSHQLKGSAGGYGFGPITTAAAQVEQLATTEKQLQEMEGAIAELLSLCRQASSKP